MKKQILSSISTAALVVLLSSGAYAQPAPQPVPADEIQVEKSSSGNIAPDAKKAWDGIKKDASTAYEDVKAKFVGEKYTSPASTTTTSAKTVTVDNGSMLSVDSRKTASGIIGKPVYNEKGESIAKVTDIVLDSKGKAVSVILADGEFIGMGKKVAFTYTSIMRVNADGDVIMPVTETMIDNAVPFTYDTKDTADGKNVMPVDGISVAKLLDADLLNFKGEKQGDVDNVTFQNGSADKLIIGYDKTMGMGGEKTAMNFSDVKMIRKGDDLDLQMSEKQSALFDTYKKSIPK